MVKLLSAGDGVLDSVSVGGVSVHVVTDSKGVGAKRSDSEHLLFFADTPARNVIWADGGPGVHRLMPSGTVAYLPPGMGLEIDNLVAHDGLIISLPVDRFERMVSGVLKARRFSPADLLVRQDAVLWHVSRAMRSVAALGGVQNWPLLVDSVMAAGAARLVELVHGDGAVEADDLGDSRLGRAIDFIEANLSRPLRLVEIASAAGASEFHFVRLFKRGTGETPLAYVWRRRVERAKAMLRDSGQPIAAVCYACGFSSQQHFTTVFRRLTGMTPGEFRRDAGGAPSPW